MNITVKYNDIVLTEATQEDFDNENVVSAEGNYYFDKSLLNQDALAMHGEGQQYTCPIKQGTCDYYNIVVDGELAVEDAGWIYEHVENSLFKQIEGKMAFYANKVTIDTE